MVWLSTLATASGGALLGMLDYLVTSLRLGAIAVGDSVLLAAVCTTTIAASGAVIGALYGAWLAGILRWV